MDILFDEPHSKIVRYLHPSTLIGVKGKKLLVIGPKCLAEISGTDASSMRAALLAAGAIREISAKQYKTLAKYYRNTFSSRNAAFFDAVGKTPTSAITRLDRLQKMRIAVIGCGGIGSATAFLLASLGVRELVLVDPDKVESSNLNRQFLYTLRSSGKNKVHELKAALLTRFTNTAIRAIPHQFPSASSIRALAIASHIICVADNPPDLFLQMRAFVRPDQEIWSAGYVMGVSTTLRHRTHELSSPIAWLTTPAYFAPSVSFQNMEIAASLVRRIAMGGRKQGKSIFDYRDA